MSDLREAAQQALEALENLRHSWADARLIAITALRTALAQQAESELMLNGLTQEETAATASVFGLTQRAKSAAQAFKPTPMFASGDPGVMLEAQQAEPVAWINPDHLQKARVAPLLCRVEPTKRWADFVPLYTAPPQRKPLTEGEARKLCRVGPVYVPNGVVTRTPEDYRCELEVARFSGLRLGERAHGIGGDDGQA